MNIKYTIQFQDASDNVLVENIHVFTTTNWKIELKSQVSKMEKAYPAIEWSKVNVLVEKI